MQNMSRIVAATMRAIRKIQGVSLRDRRRNDDLCKSLVIRMISEQIKVSQIHWYGHIRRREEEQPSQQALKYMPERK